MTELDSKDIQQRHSNAELVSGATADDTHATGYDVTGGPVDANKPSSTTSETGASTAYDEPPVPAENPFAHAADHAHPGQAEGTPDLPTRPSTEPHEPRAEAIPPEVESLKAMFPDFDVAILQSVLGSVAGNQERAADVLLGMSDPNYQSQHQDSPSQADLDEQLARRLAYEDQQRQQQHQPRWQPNNQYRNRGEQQPFDAYHGPQQQGNFYEESQSQWNNNQGGAGGKDTMSEVQEQFTKLAETGKKTFSSLVTKVKAKMQEFDQSRNAPNTKPQSSWGSGTPGSSSSNQDPSPQTQGHYFAPPATQRLDATSPNAPVPATSTAYDSRADMSTPINTSLPPSERIPPRPPSTGPPPPGNVDPAKIGMLPKRVSVLGTTPPQSNIRRDEEEDELDYVENPFAEGRK